jgi:hypothetical protein
MRITDYDSHCYPLDDRPESEATGSGGSSPALACRTRPQNRLNWHYRTPR